METKSIVGYEGYTINTNGEVRGKSGKILKPSPCRRGYMRVWLYDSNGKRKEKYIHRLLAEAFISGDKSLTVNHIDGNKTNNSLSNLEWISNEDNLRHSFRNGHRDTKKAWKTRRKTCLGLTCVKEEDINDIINKYKNGMTKQEIADFYNIHRSSIARVLKYYKRNKLCC